MAAARGLVAAGLHVTLIEPLPRLGGDCFGVDVPLRGGGTVRIDAGVSDFNADTFVRLGRMLDELGLKSRPICQDASFMTPEGDVRYFVRDRELRVAVPGLDPGALGALIARFNTECVEVLEDDRFEGWTLDRYLSERGYAPELAAQYLYPRTIGCFCVPDGDPGAAPIRSLVGFWKMHGLVGRRGSSRRMCVVGGMHVYCAALEAWLRERGAVIRCGTRVIGIVRGERDLEVRAVTRDDEHLVLSADHVVIATNPHEVAPLLEDATREESEAFGAIVYQRARLVVHTDPALMPRRRETWGAYNYLVPRGVLPRCRPTITFHPNRMLGLPETIPDIFVTMNPGKEPRPEHVVTQRFFEHPVLTDRTARAAARIDRLQGRRNVWFAGSYLAEPFLHEQAVVTGHAVAERILAALDPADRRRERAQWAGQGIEAMME